jgi:tRNA threonylcarbamoyl adenosine modification protein YeaZ
MRVLAIDTALEACSVGVLDTERAEMTASEMRPMARGHAEALMPLVAEIMKMARLSFPELDRIAVTTGPGSFTGLRVGIAAARGIGLAAGKPVVGLTTLSALAAPYIAADDSIPVTAAIDARHEHVYLQVFGPAGRTTVGPRLASLPEALRAASTEPARLVGSGARALADRWTHADRPIVIDERRAPDIDWVARLGAAAIEGQAPPKPFYLRAPDAQPQDAARLPRR